MSFLFASLRASVVLLLLAGAPRAGCAAPTAAPAPGTPAAARTALATDSATASPLVRLRLGKVEVRMQSPTSPAAQTVVLLGRVVVRGLRFLTGHGVESF